MERHERAREVDPRSVPWPIDGEDDLVTVDTTWGELQRLETAPGVQTVGELELVELVRQGAVVVDCRTAGSFGGQTIPGSINIPHTDTIERRAELDEKRIAILFCNGLQSSTRSGAQVSPSTARTAT